LLKRCVASISEKYALIFLNSFSSIFIGYHSTVIVGLQFLKKDIKNHFSRKIELLKHKKIKELFNFWLRKN